MKFNHKQAQRIREIFLGSKSEIGLPTGNILLGIIIVLLDWMVEFIIQDQEISIYGLIQIHRNNISLFFVDLIPLLLGVGGYYLERLFKQIDTHYLAKIKSKQKLIDKNIEIAQNISDKQFKITEAEIDKDDILGKSLIRMRDNLMQTTQKETEQNWIAAGKDIVSDILRLHNDIEVLAYETLVALIKYTNVIQGAFYLYEENEQVLINRATYAYNRQKYINQRFKIGEGLIGQAAYEMATIYLKEIPDNYITITSGLLKDQKPNSLVIVPLITDDKLQGIMEYASFQNDFTPLTIRFLEEISDMVARTLFNLKVNFRTEQLLKDAQIMTKELRENEEKLRQNAEDMRMTQEQLEFTNTKLESQIQAVEDSQRKIHSLLENASEVISIYDENQKLVYVSPSVSRIYGFTPQEMMEGKDIDRLTFKGAKDVEKMFIDVINNSKETVAIQYTFLRKDGKKIYVETIARNLLNTTSIQGIVVNSQDITERKRAEKEERMKSKMQSLSENSLDMIMRTNVQGNIFYANPVVKAITELDTKEIVGKNISEIDINQQIKDFFINVLSESAKRKKKYTYETIFPTNYGNRIMQVNAIPEYTEDNELETILLVAHDITEQKQIENEIKTKNKNITESINYAERIQKSLLPDIDIIHKYLPKSFVFYQPKDVVSGDFPWFFVKEDLFFIAAVDCTGHGVPAGYHIPKFNRQR
jgi:PAS domain S-box-containing protein